MKRVLITGGNGNLGRLVAERLEAVGLEVVSFDLPGTQGDHSAARYKVVLGDMRDTAALRAVFEAEQPDGVIHLASLLSGSSEANPALAWAVNATASVELMGLAQEFSSGPFVFASTIATYGAGGARHLTPDAPQWPENVYGATKVAVERMGFYLKSKGQLDFRCLRFPMVLSPFAPPGAVTAYPSHAFVAAAKGEAFTFPVAASTGMSTLFLEDVTRSLAEFLQADGARLRQPAYNLHGYHFSAGELAKVIAQRVPNAQFSFAPAEPVNSMIDAWPDTMDSAAAKQDWDWVVGYDFEKTCEAMFERVGV